MPFDKLVAHRTYFEESFGFPVQALAVVAVKRRFLQDAEHSFGPEVVLIVETMYGAEDVVSGQSRILDVLQLVAAFVNHLVFLNLETVSHSIVIHYRPGIYMRH